MKWGNMNKIDKEFEDVRKNFNFLGRERFYIDLKESLIDLQGNVNVALNGSWGSGKTFLIKKFIDDIDNNEKVFGFYFNAWENDYFESPIYAMINSLLDDEEFNNVFQESVRGDDEIDMHYGFGFSIFNVTPTQSNKYDEILSSLKNSKYSIQLINHLLVNYMINKNKRMIFIIDELDRCKPNFVISLLEQIKHIRHESIVFLFIVDSKQLEKTINGFYGSDYNSTGYLYKIFDYTFSLPHLELRQLFDYFVKVFSKLNYFEFIEGVVYESLIIYDVTLRDINRAQYYISKMLNQSLHRNSGKTEVYNALYNSIIFILCLLRIKQPELIRRAVTYEQPVKELNDMLSSIESLLVKFSEARSLKEGQGLTLESMMKDILSKANIKEILF